jgi:4-hydroxybenzoate polyprenyltransferase
MLTDFFMNSLSSSVLLHTASNPAISFTSISSFFYTYFNIIVGQFFFLVSIIIGTCLLLKMHTEKVRAVLRNIRPERLAHYLGLAVLGAAFALYRGETISFGWTTILPAIVLIVSITCAWIAAVFSNDLIDIEADKISDPLRPLTSGTLSRTEMRDVAIVAQIIALTGAFLIGPTTTYLIATFSIMYAIYSLPPLRLKQVPFLASTLIAIACIAILLTGFFFVNSSGNIHALPVSWLFASALFFFIISHVRELKDIGADAATGVLTVAGILGPRYAAKIIGGLSSIASIVYPIFILKSWLAFLVFIPIGLASLIIATKQNRPERAIFAIYLFWLAVFIMLLV